MKKIVAWRHIHTGKTEHGMPLEEELADAWVEYGNREYLDIDHLAIDADITKWGYDKNDKNI